MSVTIENLAKNSPDWSPNISGWRLCGFVNLYGGSPFYLEGIYRDDGVESIFNCPRPPDDATKAQAKLWATRIEYGFLADKPTTNVRFDALFAKAIEDNLFDGSAVDLMEYIRRYRDWLRNCGGYRSL